MTGSGTGGSTALERDGVLHAGGVEGAGSSPALLKIEGLSKTFGGTRALIDVDLDVREHEIHALVGQNGSGKSTLIKSLAGYHHPDPGARARTERARLALSAFGLAERERNTPGQLSGGQQQRVAIARALINHPGLLLADEPTGNLDTRTSHEIMEDLVRLNREQGVTVIVVTHEADIAAYADRVITMRDGQIVADERKSKPIAQPRVILPPVSRTPSPCEGPTQPGHSR